QARPRVDDGACPFRGCADRVRSGHVCARSQNRTRLRLQARASGSLRHVPANASSGGVGLAVTGAMSRRAIVAGATGLVGGWRIVDFAALPELTQADVFCALGTTIKRAGSKEAFWKVDHDFVVRLAKRAKQAGAPRFLLVSALGADEHSKLFYNQVKGTTERDVLGLGLAQVCIFRPSLLVGEREERRFGEGLASLALRAFEPLMRAGLSKYRPVAAAVVARAMLRVALDDGLAPGQHCFESDRIAELGAS